MSTSSVGGSSFFNGTLTSAASSGISNPLGAQESITGLGSGLNTTAIINELLAINEVPLNALTLSQDHVNAQQQQLTTIQTDLQNVINDAQALGSPALFASSQSVTTSDPSTMTATTSSGAAVGSYEVSVTQLASSSQRTFTFTSPASADTITIDGVTEHVTAGQSIQSLASQINSDPNATVYAAAITNGTLVLSDRATGDNGSNYIQVSDPGGTLVEQTALAVEGRNAQFSVNGGSTLTSKSNTATNAIPGVSLTLTGLTNTGPVTVNVAPPSASSSSIASAVNQFVSDYNSTIAAIQTQLSQAPVSNPQNATAAGQGTLYGDEGLTSLLSSMRELMYTGGAGLPSGMASLADLGITTGAATGGAPSQSSLAGTLSVNSTTLTAAIQSNPNGVQQVLQSFASSFQSLVGADAGPGGTLSQRITSDSESSAQMSSQITDMEQTLTDQQTTLQKEFAAMETAIQQSTATQNYLSGQLSSLLSSSSGH
jgi:flagellar hook-associated protein 2